MKWAPMFSKNAKDKEGHKPLLAATILGNAALVRHLLQARAETSKAGEDKLGRSAARLREWGVFC